MGLKEKHKLTQVVLQGIIDEVTNLIQGHLSSLHTQVCKQLSQSGVSHSVIADLDSLFSDDGPYSCPFSGLATQHLQQSFYRKHFKWIVSNLHIIYVTTV